MNSQSAAGASGQPPTANRQSPSASDRLSGSRLELALAGRTGAVLAAAIVGTVAGVASITFREAFAALQSLGFGESLAKGVAAAAALPPLMRATIPVAGGLLVGVLVWTALPDRRPHGVADVIEAGMLRGGSIPLKTGLLAALASTLSLGCGASVGREGPMVHLGATLGSWLTIRLRLPASLVRRMLACGAAAGVAASFNAPIAGAIFAAEVVVGRYTLYTFAPIVVASICGTIVSRLYYGDHPDFDVPSVALTSYLELPAFALLGVLCAGLAIVLIRAIEACQNLHGRCGVHPMLRPAVGGLAVGLIAIAFPQVLGVGYETTSVAIGGLLPVTLALMLVAAKLVATAISLGSGFGGGIFSPALLCGAVFGCAIGSVAAALFPESSAGPTAYALVGMGSMSSAVLGAPLSTTLIVFEMTGNYPVTIAVMLATVTSSVLVNEVWGRSFFTWQLASRGIDTRIRRADALLAAIPAADVADIEARSVPAEANVAELHSLIADAGLNGWVVVGADGRALGRLAAEKLAAAAQTTAARDLVDAGWPVMPIGATLLDALSALRESGADRVIIETPQTGAPLPLLTLQRAMDRYHDVLDRVYVEEHGLAGSNRAY